MQAAKQTGHGGRTFQKTRYVSAAGAETGGCLEEEEANYTEPFHQADGKRLQVQKASEE